MRNFRLNRRDPTSTSSLPSPSPSDVVSSTSSAAIAVSSSPSPRPVQSPVIDRPSPSPPKPVFINTEQEPSPSSTLKVAAGTVVLSPATITPSAVLLPSPVIEPQSSSAFLLPSTTTITQPSPTLTITIPVESQNSNLIAFGVGGIVAAFVFAIAGYFLFGKLLRKKNSRKGGMKPRSTEKLRKQTSYDNLSSPDYYVPPPQTYQAFIYQPTSNYEPQPHFIPVQQEYSGSIIIPRDTSTPPNCNWYFNPETGEYAIYSNPFESELDHAANAQIEDHLDQSDVYDIEHIDEPDTGDLERINEVDIDDNDSVLESVYQAYEGKGNSGSVPVGNGAKYEIVVEIDQKPAFNASSSQEVLDCFPSNDLQFDREE